MIISSLKFLLQILQENAEWFCAIAITYFAYKQYAITKLQIQQDLRMRRLELAQKLDEACKSFPNSHEEATKFVEWCLSHQSQFIFLLKGEDSIYFSKLLKQALDLREQSKDGVYIASVEEVAQFYGYVEKLDYALGNAKYGLTEIKQKKEKNK